MSTKLDFIHPNNDNDEDEEEDNVEHEDDLKSPQSSLSPRSPQSLQILQSRVIPIHEEELVLQQRHSTGSGSLGTKKYAYNKRMSPSSPSMSSVSLHHSPEGVVMDGMSSSSAYYPSGSQRIVHPNYQRHTMHSRRTHHSISKHPRKTRHSSKSHSAQQPGSYRKKEACKACRMLQSEMLEMKNEKDLLQQKLTTAMHGLVLQKELNRKQEAELLTLKRRMQELYARMTISPPQSPSISAHYDDIHADEKEYEHNEYDVEMNDVLMETPPPIVFADESGHKLHGKQSIFDFPSPPSEEKVNHILLDEEEEDAAIKRNRTISSNENECVDEEKSTECGGDFDIDYSKSITKKSKKRKNMHKSKGSAVNLEQSVTTMIQELEEKSSSFEAEYEAEEFVIMEGKEGVHMTNAANSSPKINPTATSIIVELPKIENIRSLEDGMDDDLLMNLQCNTPTPLMPITDFDAANGATVDAENNESDLDEHNETERWKLFEGSELAKLFQILQYRTYCYCEREKRTSMKLKQMINDDRMYLMKMEELHSSAIAEELNILKPIFHIETLSNFLKSLIITRNNLELMFSPHQQSHDIIYKSIELHLKRSEIVSKTQPVFNWFICDYQQMWIYQQLFYNNFEQFVMNITAELHAANIYCCHKNDFDKESKYRYNVSASSSMISTYKRIKQNINKYYVNKFGGSFKRRDTFFCSPKNASRAFFKVFYDYDGNVSHLTDFLRASLVFDNFEDLYNAIFVINDYVKRHNGGVGILKYKNSFLKDKKLPNGWRTIILNVPLCGTESARGGAGGNEAGSMPIICEIQLHFCLFWQFKEKTHKMYQISRLFKIRDHETGKTKNLAIECAKKFYSNTA